MKIVCRCCEPDAPSTPLEVRNRPSLSSIRYRIGTYGSFRRAMLQEIAEHPELAALTTRRSDDYAITVLELWAAVADVLTFYQERYANEAFLRTGRFKDSVARVAALIDYRPRPGVAARSWLAFSVEGEHPVSVPVGQKVQSVPLGDEDPQTYETIEGLKAFEALSDARIYPAPLTINPLATERVMSPLHRLDGPVIAARLNPDDTVVLFNDGSIDGIEEKKIASLTPVDDRLILRWTHPVKGARAGGFLSGGSMGMGVLGFVGLGGFGWGVNPGTILGGLVPKGKSFGGILGKDLLEKDLLGKYLIAGGVGMVSWDTDTMAYKFKRTFRLFGCDAPSEYMKPKAVTGNAARVTWELKDTPSLGLPQSSSLYLDAEYQDLEVGKRLLVADKGTNGKKTLVTIQEVAPQRVTFGPLTATVTRVDVTPSVPQIPDRSDVQIYELIGERIAFDTQEYPTTLSGDTIWLPGVAIATDAGTAIEVGRVVERDGFKAGRRLLPKDLEKGRTLLLRDRRNRPVRATVRSFPVLEPASPAEGSFCHLKIEITPDATLSLATASSRAWGNVARASHGETVSAEILGSGDASEPYPRFTLQKRPLTYLPANTAIGSESTLQVRVGDTRWTEVAGLYGRAGNERAYELRADDDGGIIVQFGDGVMGGIPPTGVHNVIATYRAGSGLAGRVAAGTLTTLLQKPRGLVEVTNPLAAEGGADPENLETARLRAPRTVRTFGRIVSLDDFADQVTASGEVAKALATPVWDGLEQAVHLTIGGQDGGTFSKEARRELGLTLDAARDSNHRLVIDNYVPIYVQLKLGVGVESSADPTKAQAAVKAALLDALDFDALSIGESLHLSDIYRVAQDVSGVRFVDVDHFLYKRPPWMPWIFWLILLWHRGVRFAGLVPAPVQDRLRILSARSNPLEMGAVIPGELAAIQTPDEDLIVELRQG